MRTQSPYVSDVIALPYPKIRRVANDAGSQFALINAQRYQNIGIMNVVLYTKINTRYVGCNNQAYNLYF